MGEEPPPIHAGDGVAASPWAQRAAFFAGGVVSFFVCDRLAHFVPGPTGIIEFWLSVAIGGVLLALRIRRGRQWRWLSYFAGVAFVWLAFLAMLLGPSEVENYVKTRDFDAEAWRTAKPGDSETRVWMVDDLLTHHSPVGRPVAEIDALLGPDDSDRGTGWGSGYFTEWDRVWWLGKERGFMSIDSEWLVLRVGAEGNVTAARDVRD